MTDNKLALWSIAVILVITTSLSTSTFSQLLNALIRRPRISFPGVAVTYLYGSMRDCEASLTRTKQQWRELTSSYSSDHLGGLESRWRILSYRSVQVGLDVLELADMALIDSTNTMLEPKESGNVEGWEKLDRSLVLLKYLSNIMSIDIPPASQESATIASLCKYSIAL